MDKIQQAEINTIIENIPYLNRNERELDRYKLFVSVQANTKKRIKFEDIMKLPWDEEGKSCKIMNEEEVKQAREKAKEMEARFNNMAFTQNVDMYEMHKNTILNNNG